MIRTFLNTYKFSFSEGANTLIYFLKKLPFIGKRIPEILYRKTTAKLVIGIIVEIFSFLFGFLRKAIYLGVMVILPSILMVRENGDILPIALHIFFFLSFFIGPIANATITHNQMATFKMVRLMKVKPKNYFRSKILYKRILDFIHFLPLMMIALSPLKGLILTAEFIAVKFIGEALHLILYERAKIVLNLKIWFNIVIIILGLVLAYVLPAIGLTMKVSSVFFGVIGITVISVFAVISAVYIFKYRYYREISKVILSTVANFDKDTVMVEATFSDVKINEKKFTAEDLNSKKFENKKGYEYLNAIFFMRHRKLLTIATKKRTAVVIIISILTIGATVIMPEINTGLISMLQKSGALWVFIMYMMSTSERVCKAMFYNCDASLLRYSYYREGSVILSNFKARLKRIVGLNLIPAVTICLGIIAVITSTQSLYIIGSMIPIFISIICLSCFFSIHHLFLYYVIQPYTAQLTVKSPLFSTINMVVYAVAYMCLQFNGSSYLFSLGVIGVTIVYIVIVLAVTYKFAPKTFKLR